MGHASALLNNLNHWIINNFIINNCPLLSYMHICTFGSIYETQHEVSNNVVCAISKCSNQSAHTRSLIRAFASRLNILYMTRHWPNISLKGGCTGSHVAVPDYIHLLFSTPEPNAPRWAICNSLPMTPSSVVRRRPSTFSNLFSSETNGPIGLKFHMETP